MNREYTIAERFTDNLLGVERNCGNCHNIKCAGRGNKSEPPWFHLKEYMDCFANNRKDWRPVKGLDTGRRTK